MNKQFSLLLCLLLVFSIITGCGAKSEKPTKKELISVNDLNDTLKESEEFQLIEKNEFLELYVNGTTTEIAIKDIASGQMWYSNPQDGNTTDTTVETDESDEDTEGSSPTSVSSQISIEFFDQANKVTEMNNFDDSIDLKQYTFAKIQNGIRVTYEIGKKEKLFAIPQVITKKAFEEKILSKLSEEDAEMVSMRYTCYSLSQELSEEEVAELKKTYKLIEKEDVYQINENLADFVKERLEAIISTTGYTMQDVSEDNKINGFSSPATSVFFTIPVDYLLEDHSFVAKIQTQYVKIPDNYKLTQLRLLNYFGAANEKDAGYMFVPDGSGALIHLNNGKGDMPIYRGKVYGVDSGEGREVSLTKSQQTFLPVYGMKKGDASFLAVIEQGDTVATVNAGVKGASNHYNYIYPSFELTSTIAMTVPYWRTNELNIFQKNSFDKDIAVRYFFQSGTNANYTGMALAYQDYLLKNNRITKQEVTADSVPFYLELLGAVDYKESFLGIPVTKRKALTTFEQAGKIVSKLNGESINHVVVRYQGWANGGLNNSPMNKIDVVSKLGGKGKLKSFEQELLKNNTKLYMDVDLQYIYKNNVFDTYKTVFDSPKTILGETAVKPKFRFTTGMKTGKINILTPSKYNDYANSMIKDLKKLNVNGVSLARMYNGPVISDHRSKKYREHGKIQ